MILRKVTPGSTSRLTTVDHNESYGRYILEKTIKRIKINKCIDIGCGGGNDLAIVKKYNPNASLIGIDFGSWNTKRLKELGIQPLSINIEAESLPFEDESMDFIIANQFMEHAKEVFWINHEIFRTLKVNGHFFMGTPNILTFHNRLLMLFGFHPTQHKLLSAHVRPFSKTDVLYFYHVIGNAFCRIEKFYGSQFYPFPKPVARFLSSIFPSLSFSIFFLIKKTSRYHCEFIEWPKKANLETNFYVGIKS